MSSRRRIAIGGLLAAALLGAAGTAGAQDERVRHGEYVYRAAGCAGCHVDPDRAGDGPAGGGALQTPFGIYYAPNITPHPIYGIGNWSAADFLRALRHGVAPDGTRYAPVFPYTSYTRMRAADARALFAYLRSLPAVARAKRANELPWWLPSRLANRAWQVLFFRAGVFTPNPSRDQQWNRGAYLATALAHCGECHSPRNALGAVDGTRPYAGNAAGVDGDPVPNISSHRDDGIGRWDVDDLTEYLESGMTPDADFAGGAMAEVIDNGLRFLTDADRLAIAVYLESMPAFSD